MIPIEDIPSIRTVNISQDAGTTITNDPTGDERTLFPLQSAMGYYLTQTLFIGDRNLVVEGVSDFWYMSSISDYLNETNKGGLHTGIILTPAGGAQKISYMVALLTSQKLSVVVLLDDEKNARNAAGDMVRSKLIREENVIFTCDSFVSNRPSEADIEDLIEQDIYKKLVEESYSVELKQKTLTMNNNIPRIVRRYEEAFQNIGIEFHKTRPAKLFLRRIAENPSSVMTTVTEDRFSLLFKIINDRIEKVFQRKSEPFK